MANNKGYEVEITAKATGFEAAFRKVTNEAKGAVKSVEEGFRSIEKAAGAVGVTIGIGSLVLALQAVKEKTIEGERGLNQLSAALKATGQAAGLTGKDLADLADQVQNKSIFDDDEIRKAEVALLRFRTVQGDVFREAIRLAPDLAAALGGPLEEAAQALGRALTDPDTGMRALRQAGVFLSEQQKDLAARLIETGDKAGAQKIVLDELARSVGGASEADNKGLYGATKRLTRAYDDLQKTYGKKLFSDNASTVDAITGAFTRLNKMVDETKLNLADLATKPGAALNLALDVTRTMFNIGQQADKPKRSVSGRIGGIPDPAQEAADRGRAEQEQRQAEEQRYLEQQAALKRRSEGAANAYASILASTQAYLTRESALYEDAYARNEISSAEFYAQQRRAAEQSTQAILEGLSRRGQAIEDLINAPSTSRDERFAKINELRGIAAESDKARLDLKQKILDIDIREGETIEKLKDQYASLDVKLAELQGNKLDAAQKAFDLANKELTEKLNAQANSPNPIARDRAAAAQRTQAAIRELTLQQAELNKLTEDYDLALGRLSVQESLVGSARAAGFLTEIESLTKISDLNKAQIPVLTEIAEKYERIAELTNDPRAKLFAEQMRAKIAELAAQTDLLGQKFQDIFASAFSDALVDVATGVKSVKEAFNDLTKSIVANISRIAANSLADALFKGNGPGAGIGDIFARLFSYFGGGAGAGAGALQSGLGGGLGYAAAGSNFTSGGPYVVGERGPELVLPPRGSAIVPNDKLKSWRQTPVQQSTSNVVNNNSVHIHVTGQVDARTARQIGREAGMSLSATMARG